MNPRDALRVWLLILAAESSCGLPTDRNTESSPQIRAEEQPENLLQTLSLPSSSTSTQSWPQQPDLHPSPAPEGEEPGAFILDLRNFPDLANAYVGSQNPNIQVTIEVMEDSQTEVEMDLAKENQRSDWSVSPSEWMSRKLFWPLFWESGLAGTGPEDYGYAPADAVLGGVGTDGWSKDGETKDGFENEEWSDWAPCSTTCGPGSQKRTRSCGYGCTATESRTCDLDSCSSAVVSETEATSLHQFNISDSSVDSCEKWLSCRNDFLQKYLHQVLTQLPSCPCSYPSEAVYGAISIPDRRLRRTYRWRDASGPKERLDVYKPSARFCVRSMLSYDGPTLGAQHCCYDDRTRLITRGKGAGAPDLIGAEFSPELHYQVDVLPWILCKGDWSRFHSARPPNNGLTCPDNPAEPAFQTELREAREY
ncbi:isthmin-2-like isoform X1 [Xiphophorus hellerii]|uniref:isthmin-2-like isoform X1 n=1 Tax=Xiphophorus hellerii TaxID=8084 RepID=UPI0013B3AFB5|nr:isthmin-2-like isoform X1 [Xiphophorus hellerii]